jgi:cytochrome c oxidase assembly protein subunit 15
MTVVRRLAYATLVLAFLQIVFGAIVRITGSGLGCGDHWPDCYGSYTPAHRGLALLIEISHRYGAATLSAAVVALVLTAFFRRAAPGVGGPGGALRSSTLAAGLVVVAALVGAATVKLGLNPLVIVAHLAIAMSLLAVLSVTVQRAGGLGALSDMRGATTRTWRAATIALVLAALTLILGALTANLPGAAAACGGFPWCRWVQGGGTSLVIHIVHRAVAFLLFGHLWGVAVALPRRNEPRAIVRAAQVAFGAAIVQVLIGAAMVEMNLPTLLRSLHQATGTFVWLSVCVFAGLARIALPAAETAAEAPLVEARA